MHQVSNPECHEELKRHMVRPQMPGTLSGREMSMSKHTVVDSKRPGTRRINIGTAILHRASANDWRRRVLRSRRSAVLCRSKPGEICGLAIRKINT